MKQFLRILLSQDLVQNFRILGTDFMLLYEQRIRFICAQDLFIQAFVQNNEIILYLNSQNLLTFLYIVSWPRACSQNPRSYLQDGRIGYIQIRPSLLWLCIFFCSILYYLIFYDLVFLFVLIFLSALLLLSCF